MEEMLREIRQDVKELVKQGAVHNTLLQEHERRSLALEEQSRSLKEQLEPIKEHVRTVGKALKYGGAILVGIVIQAVARLLL